MLQVLKYEKNQRYGVHHDYGAEDVKLSCGPRILTFFLYLSGMHCLLCYTFVVTAVCTAVCHNIIVAHLEIS